MNFLFVVAAVGFIAIATGAPPSDDHKKHHHGPPQCLGKNLTLSEEMKTAEKSCRVKQPEDKTKTGGDKKTKDHHHHHPTNMTCHTVCKYQAFGLVSADHKVNTDKIEAFVKQVFPESVTAVLTKDIKACADKNGAGLSVKDGKCDSYAPLFKCVRKSIKENCKNEDDDE